MLAVARNNFDRVVFKIGSDLTRVIRNSQARKTTFLIETCLCLLIHT